MKRLQADNLNAPTLAHGFFGREGGVSTGLYASLNCGPGSRDDPAAVRENRRLVAAELAAAALAPGCALVSLSQIHSPIVHVLQAPPTQPLEGDAMVTRAPGLALGILAADCAPVLLADAQAGVIGAAHAGWKGAIGGVLEAVCEAMERLGAERGRIAAAIGPCIAQANYEVSWDFRDRFLELGLRNRKFFIPSDKEGHYRFDLEDYAAHRLSGIGSIEKLGVCTYPPENGFFSFRRATHAGEPDYGRQVSAILLTP